jgi:hypothetical protein
LTAPMPLIGCIAAVADLQARGPVGLVWTIENDQEVNLMFPKSRKDRRRGLLLRC